MQATLELGTLQCTFWTAGTPLPEGVWVNILAAVEKAGIAVTK
jgi:hypothetical protein